MRLTGRWLPYIGCRLTIQLNRPLLHPKHASRNTPPAFWAIVRIHAATSLSEVNTIAEWVGRLTGDPARPALIMLWEHGLQNGSMTCGNRL
jgi:hypothetical protein